MTTFMGMRGNGDWVTDARPKSWREMILKLYPNGQAPLTAILSKMQKEQVTDPEFKWWTESFQNQGGALTGIYKSSDLSTANAGSTVTVGQVMYVKMAEDVAKHFRPGHQAILRNTSDYAEDCNGKITDRVLNGADSYVIFRALQTSTADPDSEFNRILIVGNINPEGGAMPTALTYDPVKWHNYTQIWRTPLSLTRTAMKTKLRTGDQYQRAKMQALEMHSVEMEKSLLFGFPTEGTGDNGKPERTTMGLIPAIRGIDNAVFSGYPDVYTNYNGVVSHYPSASGYTTKTWLEGAEDWIDENLEIIFRYGDSEKIAFCGNKVLLGLSRLVKQYGNFEFTPMTEAYGIKIKQWVTNFGVVNFISHPLFNLEESLRGTAVIFEPRNLIFRYIDDTDFYDEGEKQNTGAGRIDGISEEYLTEAGLEFHHPIGWGLMTGWNENGNAV